MQEQIEIAANHFLYLYSEETKETTPIKDVIFEWWGHTKDQYPNVQYEDVEARILEQC